MPQLKHFFYLKLIKGPDINFDISAPKNTILAISDSCVRLRDNSSFINGNVLEITPISNPEQTPLKIIRVMTIFGYLVTSIRFSLL